MLTKSERVIRIAKKRAKNNLRRKRKGEERHSRRHNMPRAKGKLR